MKRLSQFAVASLAVPLFCWAANAQTRGASAGRVSGVRMAPMAPRSISAGPPRSISHATRRAGFVRIVPGTTVASSFSTTGNSGNFSTIGVPGLGFDYAHLAAINGGLANRTVVGGGERGLHHLRQTSFVPSSLFVPLLIGGYPYYGDYEAGYATDNGYPEEPPQVEQQQQPQVIVVQQPVPIGIPQQAVAPASDVPPAAETSAPPTPSREAGDFILVRRDGRILFASAYSVIGDRLRYVTPEGIRRSLLMAELDRDATEQMNEARGTTLQFHN